MKAWQNYQEDAASYFRSLGLEALTDVKLKGVRTSHNIDVLVRSHHVGFDITWVVECKQWRTPVSKLHVLALREIINDIGADRGILLSEAGFQSGAKEAANLTNVQVTSISEMRNVASESINSMRLRELFDRVGICKDRYWEISKDQRIKFGLRTDGYGYSGARVVEMCFDLLTRAFRGIYPFQSDTSGTMIFFGKDKKFESSKEIVEVVVVMVKELEAKLDNYDRETSSS